MSQPDTLLVAARKVADIAGLPWSFVQPYYRALQPADGNDTESWLPKSVGRNIWHAHPNYVARLLIALGGSSTPEGAREAIVWARETTPDGRALYIDELPAANVIPPVEKIFWSYLVDGPAAADLVQVEFRSDQRQIIFHTKSEGEISYRRPFQIGEGRNDEPRRFRGIHTRGVIEGTVFAFLSKAIAWRMNGQAPLRTATHDEADEE